MKEKGIGISAKLSTIFLESFWGRKSEILWAHLKK